MGRLVLTGVILIVSLCLCAISVLLLNDGTIIVPPPEQVSESFFKQVQMKRYSRAIPLLEASLEHEVTPYVLNELRQEVESRIGKIEKVKGKKGAITGDSASASAQLTGKDGSIRIPIKLVRQQGVWKVTSVMLNVQ